MRSSIDGYIIAPFFSAIQAVQLERPFWQLWELDARRRHVVATASEAFEGVGFVVQRRGLGGLLKALGALLQHGGGRELRQAQANVPQKARDDIYTMHL